MKFKVMVCDDSKLMRKKLKNFLELSYKDIDVLVAENGKNAVEVYEAEKPNLVFFRYCNANIRWDWCVKTNKKLFDNDAKVVITSSSGTKQKLKEALESGAVEFIQKPWTEDKIKFVVDKFMSEGE